jgi:hypothetical protein
LIETQSHTLESQAQKILWLEEQHSEIRKALNRIEGKLADFADSKVIKGIDDDGAYIEV